MCVYIYLEEVNKLDDVDLKTLARYIEKCSTKIDETFQVHQLAEGVSSDPQVLLD